MKKPILIVIFIAVLAAVAWRVFHRTDFLYAGTVEATEVDISSQVSAVISTVTVTEGNDVKVGQTLVTLAGEDLKLAADNAEHDYNRAVGLHKSGSMSDEMFERFRYRRDDTALRVRWCTISSPLDGTVLNRYHEPGELVNPSVKLLTLANLSEVWATVYVPPSMVAKITLNSDVEAFIPELDMKRRQGRVSHISDRAEFTPKNVQTREERTRLVYAVKLSFSNSDGLLKPGMTIEARLPGDLQSRFP